jgi:otoferlin
LKGSTSVIKHTRSPVWNETISFIDFYPPMWNRVRVHLISRSKLSSRILAEHCIPIEQISIFSETSGKKYLNQCSNFLFFLPSESPPDFGPAFIHMYSDTRVYQGRVLISIRTDILQDISIDKSKFRKVEVVEDESQNIGVINNLV